MASKREQHSLQLDAHMDHQRREWRIERVGWVAMMLLLLAGLLGLFGYGPVSKTRHGEASSLAVEYDRLQRSSAPTEWRFDVAAPFARHGELRLRLDASLIEDMQIDSITPEPDRAYAMGGATEYRFDVAPGADARIVFRFRPETFGRRRGHASVPGARPVVIDQFIYP